MTVTAFFNRILVIGIAALIALTMVTAFITADQPKIAKLDIASGIIEALKSDSLTEDTLNGYFEKNSQLLRNNIDQGLMRYKKKTVREAVALNFEKYVQNKENILANWDRFSQAGESMAEKISAAFNDEIPGVILVPCIGLYANGGWADTIKGTKYIFAALEIIPVQLDSSILLIHEVAHAISEVGWDILLDGIYNEGYSTYVAYKLSPGMPLSSYFMMDPVKIKSCFEWMSANREKLARDIDQPLAVMNDLHKFYLSTGYSEYPNIGYVIGFSYLKHLNETYSFEELRTFAMDVDKNLAAFRDFVMKADFDTKTINQAGD